MAWLRRLVAVGAPQSALLGTLVCPVDHAGRSIAEEEPDDLCFVFELPPQRRGVCFDRDSPTLQVALALAELVAAREAQDWERVAGIVDWIAAGR